MHNKGQLTCFHHRGINTKPNRNTYIHSVFDIRFDEEHGMMKVISTQKKNSKKIKELTTYANETTIANLIAEASRNKNIKGVRTALKKAIEKGTVLKEIANEVGYEEGKYGEPDEKIQTSNRATKEEKGLYKTYKKLTKEEIKNVTTEEKDIEVTINNKLYTIMGPFKMNFGGKDIKSINVGNASWTSTSSTDIYYWKATSGSPIPTTAKNWSKDFNKKNSSGKYELNSNMFYLAVNTSMLPYDGKYDVTIKQKEFEYKDVRIVVCVGTRAQDTGMYCYDNLPHKVNGEAKWTITRKGLKTLEIVKADKDTNRVISGAGFKIYAELTDGTKGWVSGQVEGDKTYGNVATEYSSKVQIKNLKKGTYYIYETKAPIGYDITTQDGYDPKNGWVNYGKVTIGDNNTNTDTSVTIYNSKYTKITGKVWLEHEMQTKTDSSYNNVYDSERDDLLKDIHVELIDKRITDPNQNVIATATTQQNGTYVIEKLKDNSKIIYDNLYNYYIRFSYDKENYITVAADLAENKPNASRALETKITAQDLDDNNLKQTTGYAVTYQNATGDKDGLGRYYNNNSHCVENVNLGLIRKIKPEYSINQNIEYVKIVRGNYTFKYKYGNEIEIENDENKFFPSVQLQNSSRSFTQPIYPSDIKYNIANKLTGNDSNAYKVYVVYKINVTNNTALDIENLYQEKALYLTELVNDYDGSRLELSHDVLNGDKTEISNDFGLWSDKTGDQASGTKTARFNVSASNKLYKEANRGISPKETESTYIEFKVKDEVLTELLTNEELRTAPTVAKSSGYHKYTRIDNSWTDNMSRKYEHKSISEDKEDAELYLKWKLTDTRTVSGTVFEDSKVNQLDGENPDSRKDERIGDGKFIDGEKTLEDVIVSLIEIDEDNNGKLANLYDGELSQDITTGKWKTDKQPAVVKVNENGEYALKGVVPGRYYLKFTYGDGKTEIKDLNGNVVEKDVNNNTIEKISTKIKGEEQAINSNYYKSTILTGSAKDANNEKTWFLGDMDKTNSIATDNTITYFDKDGNLKQEEQDIITSRTTSDKEMNYTSSQNKAVIEAISPNMDIQFEYVENPEIEMNTNTELKTNCTGMYFGIIERPHVEIELNKEISNIILTLSNGTNIINGNPQDKNVSSSLTSMDASYAKIEMNNTYLYGSSATVTYNIIATNNSELDYATEEYYKKGVKTENDQPVTTTVTKIIDYTSNSNCEYVQGSGNVKLSYNDKDYENEGYKKDDYFVQIPDVRTNNKNYKDQLLVTKDELMPTKAKKEKNKANYFVTVKKLLSNLDDNLGWESYSEIIGLKNVTYTTQYSCHSGNYKAGDTEITPNTTSEADNAETILAISPSTGADKSYTYWIAGAIALIVIAGGIIFLKKKVLK